MFDHDAYPVPDLTDDELVAALRRISVEVDPVPETVRAAAHAALATRDLDGELAVLVADSAAVAGRGFEPVRGVPDGHSDSRLLSFSGGGVQVDVEVSERGGRLDVIGQITGAVPADGVLEHARGDRYPLTLDPLGRFLATGVRRGPARIRCRGATGTAVRTAWVWM